MRVNPTMIEVTFDRGTLLLRGLDRFSDWKFDPRVGCLRAHAIHYAAAREQLLRQFGNRFIDHVRRPPPLSWSKVDLHSLRPEQDCAVRAWQQAGGRGVVVMPTGTGKTEVALAAMAEARVATLVVAPVRDLMHQWHRRILRGLGYDAGIVGDSIFSLQPVTVTTYDSAYARMPEMGDRFGLIIFDEAHHLPGRSYRDAAILSTAAMRLGLTATPERSDGRHIDLDWLIGPVAHRQEIAQARGGSLADYDIVRVPVKLDDQEQWKYDNASRVVQTFFLKRQEELKAEAGPDGKAPRYSFAELCAESGKDADARAAQSAFYLKKSIEDRARLS